jgi:hypothetical protein
MSSGNSKANDPVCLSGLEAFLIPVVHGLPEEVCAVLIHLVVRSATPVTIVRSHVVARIVVVIVITIILYTRLLLTQALRLPLLKTVLRQTVLLL